jgi:hypothetical protein
MVKGWESMGKDGKAWESMGKDGTGWDMAVAIDLMRIVWNSSRAAYHSSNGAHGNVAQMDVLSVAMAVSQ